jgi:hypothetical protein
MSRERSESSGSAVVFGALPKAAALLICSFAIGEYSRGDETDCAPCHEAEDAENGNDHDRFACWRGAPNSETFDLGQRSICCRAEMGTEVKRIKV